MNLSDEIRKQIEKNKGLKLAVGEINNHLSILEGLTRKDIMEQVDDAYQRGLEDGKAVHERGCEGCLWEGSRVVACTNCCNAYKNKWIAKDDKIEVGDEVTHKSDSITWTAVVTQNVDGILTLMDENGAIAESYDEKYFVKTGRHFDIESILEAMKA